MIEDTVAEGNSAPAGLRKVDLRTRRGSNVDGIQSDDGANGITAARLGLALTVVVSHSFTFSGGMGEPLVAETGQVSLGFVAVLGFFGLSGYLLARSRERSGVVPFLRNRALRILPGYWLALVFGAFAAALGALLVGGGVEPGDLFAYVFSNVAVVPVVRSIGPAFGGSPVNAALWTLGIEVLCYLVLAFTPVRWLRPVAVGLIPALLGVYLAREGLELQLALAFLTGSCAYLFRVPVTVLGSMVALGFGAAGYMLHVTPLASMAVALASLGLAKVPLRWERDISYGVYVLAYPLQQLLALTVVATWGVGAMALATIILVLPMAWLSWTVLESRALRLRSRHLPAVEAASASWWSQWPVLQGFPRGTTRSGVTVRFDSNGQDHPSPHRGAGRFVRDARARQ